VSRRRLRQQRELATLRYAHVGLLFAVGIAEKHWQRIHLVGGGGRGGVAMAIITPPPPPPSPACSTPMWESCWNRKLTVSHSTTELYGYWNQPIEEEAEQQAQQTAAAVSHRCLRGGREVLEGRCSLTLPACPFTLLLKLQFACTDCARRHPPPHLQHLLLSQRRRQRHRSQQWQGDSPRCRSGSSRQLHCAG
jgi:hypothetical protein